MPINLSHLSQKQSMLAIVGIVVAAILLALLGSMYGKFLKTQVASPAESYSASGSIKASRLQDPGTYRLTFHAQTRNAVSFADVSTTFQVVADSTPTPTPNTSATPLPITPTPTSALLSNLISENLTVPTNLVVGQQLRFTANAKNNGTATAAASRSAFCVDNTNNNCKNSFDGRIPGYGNDVPSLAAGQSSSTFTSDPWTATAGIHTLKNCVDVNNEVPESDESEADNCTSRTFTVAGQ